MGLSLSSLLDPGALAHQLVDSFLPKDLQWVGGLVGAAIDYQCGNVPGALSQGMSTLSDLKDVPQSPTDHNPTTNTTSSKGASAAPSPLSSQSFDYEPSPPEPRASTTVTTTITTTERTSASAPAASGAGASKTAAPPTPLREALDANLQNRLARGQQVAAAPSSAGSPTPTNQTPARTPDATTPVWRGSPPEKTAGVTTTTITITSSSASPTETSPPVMSSLATNGTALQRTEALAGIASRQAAASRDATAPSATKSSPADSASQPAAQDFASNAAGTTPATKSSGTDASTLSKDNFMKLSNDDFMKAVRDGKIPSEVTDSQASMLALQARMTHISEMNQMMTSMMQAMHQMKMGVIENIRA